MIETLLEAMPNEDKKQIEKAIAFAQNKLDKEDYLHSILTAELLIEKQLDTETIIASTLHDIEYYGKGTHEEIKKEFGEKVAEIVQEATQIQQTIDRNFPKIKSETMSLLILSIASNIQTLVIQLAEIITLFKHPNKKQDLKRLIKVTKDIYIPLSIKLGLSNYTWDLQDLVFYAENPQAYEKIKQLVGKTKVEREQLIEEVKKEMLEALKGKISCQISGRPKGLNSIYEKMKKTPFDKINDIYGIRIICNKEKECYEVLGYIHSLYKLLPDAFDDYFAKPKENGYKSIHTAVKRGEDTIEVQIRTWEQHMRIESNLYWEYKRIKSKKIDQELSWERQLIEWQKSIGESAERKKIISKHIFAFTPKNDVIQLSAGATAIDFAFAVHTDIGKKMKKVIINNKLMPIETKLNNLDKVEIITDSKPQIKSTWLNYATTEKARSKIKTHFGIQIKKTNAKEKPLALKKIKMADCCHPLPGEDVIGVKTTKRKIIIHKKNCPNIKKIQKSKLIEINFETAKGKTRLRVVVVDRIGLLGEILTEIKKSGAKIIKTNFEIKKTGYAEALFDLESENVNKIERLMERIENLPSVQNVKRE